MMSTTNSNPGPLSLVLWNNSRRVLDAHPVIAGSARDGSIAVPSSSLRRTAAERGRALADASAVCQQVLLPETVLTIPG